MYFGILNIAKPLRLTSRDVVNRVQRLVRPAKCGHAGTLDPLATGVLLVCVGPATRLIEYAQRLEKRYRATFLLGHYSPSDDTELPPEPLTDAPRPSRADVEAALPNFLGRIEQRPPAYSAVKLGGRRAFDLARRGEAVELAPRPVTIHDLEIIHYEYPTLRLDVRCGSGTYIRSLGRDLAESLGTAAVMTELVRTAVGPFAVGDAVAVDQLDAAALAAKLHPPTSLLAGMPRIELTPEEAEEIRHGRTIPLAPHREALERAHSQRSSGRPGTAETPDRTGSLVVIAALANGRLVALLKVADPSTLRAFRNFQ